MPLFTVYIDVDCGIGYGSSSFFLGLLLHNQESLKAQDNAPIAPPAAKTQSHVPSDYNKELDKNSGVRIITTTGVAGLWCMLCCQKPP